MKKLKDSCENAKKILSISNEVNLTLSELYDDINIDEVITRKDFEILCNPVFERIISIMKKELSDHNIDKKDISGIILVGGSTRIPKIKDIIKDFFCAKIKIYDYINPDEVKTHGAAIEAGRFLYNGKIPFSLGFGVFNQSNDNLNKNKEEEMKEVIKSGSLIPICTKTNFFNVYDNQTSFSINLFKGENKYAKFNYLIKTITLKNLTPRPKGKTKISIEINVNIDGNMSITAAEESEKDQKGYNVIKWYIKKDELDIPKFTEDKLKNDIEKLSTALKKEKIIEQIEFNDIISILKRYQKTYDESIKRRDKNEKTEKDEDEEENKKYYFAKFIEIYEKYLDSFEQYNNNEAILEAYYLYLKELFSLYNETLKLDVNNFEQNSIFYKIEKYLKIFIKKNSGYLNKLLDIFNDINKVNRKIKYNLNKLITNIILELNDYGIEYFQQYIEMLKDIMSFDTYLYKYLALTFFEQSYMLYNKYLSEFDKIYVSDIDLKRLQKEICYIINDIKTDLILIDNISDSKISFYDEIQQIFLIFKKYSIDKIELEITKRKFEILLSNIQISNNRTKIEAKCIFYILKTNYFLEPNKNNKILFLKLAIKCDSIIKSLNISNEFWCKEFYELYKNLKIGIKKIMPKNNNQRSFKSNLRLNDNFMNLERNIENYNGEEFIKFIIENSPYRDLKVRADIYNYELVINLMMIYYPNNIKYDLNSYDHYESEHIYNLFKRIFEKLEKLLDEYLISLQKEVESNSKILVDEKIYITLNKKIKTNLKEISKEEIEELKNYINIIFNRVDNNIYLNDKKKFLEKSIIVSRIFKEYIEIDKEKNYDNYISIDTPFEDFEKVYKNLNTFEDNEFLLSLFAKFHKNNRIKINITKEKDQKIPDIELASIQSLFSLGNYKTYELHFDFGRYMNQKILTDTKEKEKFLDNWISKFSWKLGIKKEKIILTDVHAGSLGAQALFLDTTAKKDEEILNGLKEIKEIVKIDEKPIFEVLVINKEILDKKGNRNKGWGINETRGGEKYLPPINGWFGIGLRVTNKYDNGNNAWLDYKNKSGEYSIGYIGINNLNNDEEKIIEDMVSLSLNVESLRSKLYVEDENIRNSTANNVILEEEEKKETEKCGDGVCVFQNPDYAENNAGFFDRWISNKDNINVSGKS